MKNVSAKEVLDGHQYQKLFGFTVPFVDVLE